VVLGVAVAGAEDVAAAAAGVGQQRRRPRFVGSRTSNHPQPHSKQRFPGPAALWGASRCRATRGSHSNHARCRLLAAVASPQ